MHIKYVNGDEFLKMLPYDDFNKTLKLLSSEIDPAELNFGIKTMNSS